MKAEELMIGNMVFLEGNYIHRITGKDLEYSEKEIIPCEPINISPVLLLSIGFEKEPEDFLGYSILGWFSLDTKEYHLSLRWGISNTVNRCWSAHIDNADFQSIGSCDLQYLHQLQNFMTLVGYSLSINSKDIDYASKKN